MHPIRSAAAAVLLAGAGLALRADVPGRITTTDGRQLQGDVRWQPVQKQYVLTIKQGNLPVVLNLSPAQVADVRVAPPPGWNELLTTIRDGRAAQAVPQLEKVVKDYAMLQYDVVAGQVLAQVHLRENRAADALRVAEAVIASKPEAGTTSDLAPVYWEAMLATGRTGRLAPALEEAIKSAPRPVAARAHTLRGDLLKSEGRPRDALKDGYLRTITLFRDVRDAQPEALFKAAVAFEELQQVQYAESMRQRLLSGFADSDYAKRLRGK
jgi:tetratricopeptide (TPR) repeat protein